MLPMSETIDTEKAPRFRSDMSVGEAMNLHPDTHLVFASYQLGGCSECAINELETIEQVCRGYGISTNHLIESLNNLLD